MGGKIASLLNRRTRTHKFAIVEISHANIDRLLGIKHTQKFLVRSHARFRGLLYEVAESLKRWSRFVHRNACAYLRQNQCRIPYRRVVFGGTLYTSPSGANKQVSCFRIWERVPAVILVS
jgi:hypothetical protein